MRVAVLGAGGMIGGHLVRRLMDEGHDVVAVDIKPSRQWWRWHEEAWNFPGIDVGAAHSLPMLQGCVELYHLACRMGGIGFISSHRWECMQSTRLNLNVFNAAVREDVDRVFYSSSACAYPTMLQDNPDAQAMSERFGWLGRPELGYGEEKLYGEALLEALDSDTGVTGRVARYHNVAGTPGTWTGGQEKAPAAICRKVAEAKLSGSGVIDVWGDGKATRSYLDVDDCVEGTLAVMRSDFGAYPFNIGSDRSVSVDSLVSIVEEIAGVSLERRYDPTAPVGVQGRNSDNSTIEAFVGWKPRVPLEATLERMYAWVEDRVRETL